MTVNKICVRCVNNYLISHPIFVIYEKIFTYKSFGFQYINPPIDGSSPRWKGIWYGYRF